MPCYWRLGLALLAVKVASVAAICFAAWLWPNFDGLAAAQIRETWFPSGRAETYSGWARHFATWDAQHYLYLSQEGYSPDAPSVAFYPLWPLLIRATTASTGLPGVIAGVLLANLLSLAGWLLFHWVTAKRFGARTANLALVLLIAFPGSLFYQFTYSESLFFLSIMVLWWALEQGRYDVAWVAGFAAPLIRGVGVFTLCPIVWHWLMTQPWAWLDRWGGLAADRRRVREDHPHPRWGSTLLISAPLLGWGAYLLLMWIWTGSPFAGMKAQRYWGVHAIDNLWDIPKFVVSLFQFSTWHGFTGSLLDRLAFLFLLKAIPSLWRAGKDLLVWVYALGIVPAMSGTFVSFVRFESCAFPVFLGWAVLLLGLRARWPRVVLVTASASVQGLLLWRFVNFQWAG